MTPRHSNRNNHNGASLSLIENSLAHNRPMRRKSTTLLHAESSLSLNGLSQHPNKQRRTTRRNNNHNDGSLSIIENSLAHNNPTRRKSTTLLRAESSRSLTRPSPSHNIIKNNHHNNHNHNSNWHFPTHNLCGYTRNRVWK